jgi:phenylphosphate carboxylase beta subunit
MPHKDLREFLSKLEVEGELKRIQAEVDWNLELSHVAKLNEDQEGGSALLFENVKDYPGKAVLTSLLTSKKRVALALDMPLDTRFTDIAAQWVERMSGTRIPPQMVDSGPCQENVLEGEKANLYDVPAPWVYPRDGGRYVGTAAYLISRDPETGRINLGTYRTMIIDERRAGIQIIKAKDADMDLIKYEKMGQEMPVALVTGCDPVLFLCSSTMFPVQESEYDIVGALRGEPVEVVRGVTVDLPIPATAEWVIEGIITPGEKLPEGPFGEYTGYYSGTGSHDREFIKVKAITHRNDPIFWATTVGKPVTDTHMIMGINRTSSLWNDLKNMGIPGIKSVYGPPASAGRFLVIISVEQMYPGHSTQVGLAAFATHTGNYGLKTVILVDDDIDPENMDQVIYALSFRYQPDRGTQILRRGRDTPLDPSVDIPQRGMTSRVVIDATIPYEWKEKPIPIELDPDMEAQVRKKWKEYGFEG